MARTGRPKADKPFDHKVTVKFKEEEYQIMVEYAETHNLSISQLIRMGVELQMKQQANHRKAKFASPCQCHNRRRRRMSAPHGAVPPRCNS